MADGPLNAPVVGLVVPAPGVGMDPRPLPSHGVILAGEPRRPSPALCPIDGCESRSPLVVK
jgi:hypothetical protein